MEYQFAKADILKYFNLTNESEIFNSPQVWGGTFFLKKQLCNTYSKRNEPL